MDDVEQTLTYALGLLRRDGWVQRRQNAKTGERCAVGALTDATGDLFGVNEHRAQVYLDTVRVFMGANDIRCTSIPLWNDAHTRTFEQVAEAFETAIAARQAREPVAA